MHVAHDKNARLKPNMNIYTHTCHHPLFDMYNVLIWMGIDTKIKILYVCPVYVFCLSVINFCLVIALLIAVRHPYLTMLKKNIHCIEHTLSSSHILNHSLTNACIPKRFPTPNEIYLPISAQNAVYLSNCRRLSVESYKWNSIAGF